MASLLKLRRIPACQLRTREFDLRTLKRRFFSFALNSSSSLAFIARATSILTCSSSAISCTDWCTYGPSVVPVRSRGNFFLFFFFLVGSGATLPTFRAATTSASLKAATTLAFFFFLFSFLTGPCGSPESTVSSICAAFFFFFFFVGGASRRCHLLIWVASMYPLLWDLFVTL